MMRVAPLLIEVPHAATQLSTFLEAGELPGEE
jgi:hypothetical protein